MKIFLKFVLLILATSQLSFSGKKTPPVSDKKNVEIKKEAKFTNVWAKHLLSWRPKGKANIQKSLKRAGGSAVGTVTTIGPGRYQATLFFEILQSTQHPEYITLSWSDYDLDVTCQLSAGSFWAPAQWTDSYYFTQISGTTDGQSITITGRYEEYYYPGWGDIQQRNYEFELSATYDTSTIGATVYIQDRGW